MKHFLIGLLTLLLIGTTCAVVDLFTDSDFAGGGTNNEGHKVLLAVKPMKNTEAKATLFIYKLDPDITNLNYNRLMFDFLLKF